MPAPTIVTFGDSITALRDGIVVYTDMLATDLAQRGIDATFINAGVGGHSTADGRVRFERDVLAHRPTVVAIMFGTNDAAVNVYEGATEPRVSAEQFAANLRHFVEQLRGIKATPILMLPPPACWSQVLRGYYNKPPYDINDPESWQRTTRAHRDAARRLAATLAVACVDHDRTFRDAATDRGVTLDDLMLDGMHPNTPGQRIIADALLPELLRTLS